MNSVHSESVGRCFIRRILARLARLYPAVPFFLLPLGLFANIREARLFNELIALGGVSRGYLIVRFLDGQDEHCVKESVT